MTDHEITIAMAEFDGWTNVRFYDGELKSPDVWYGIPTLSIEERFKLPESQVERLDTCGEELPSYLTDLNAVREALKKLTPLQWEALDDMLDTMDVGYRWLLSARQLCEMTLKTFGKWKD